MEATNVTTIEVSEDDLKLILIAGVRKLYPDLLCDDISCTQTGIIKQEATTKIKFEVAIPLEGENKV